MTPKFPDIRTLLPSKAREAVINYFQEYLKAEYPRKFEAQYGLTSRSDFADAYLAVREETPEAGQFYSSGWFHECFSSAVEIFNREYPLSWSNKAQKSYRKGLSVVEDDSSESALIGKAS